MRGDSDGRGGEGKGEGERGGGGEGEGAIQEGICGNREWFGRFKTSSHVPFVKR